MFKVGDYVVYKRNVCKIMKIKEEGLQDRNYYVLEPIDDKSLIIDVPIENKLGNIRKIISKEDVEIIINDIPNINAIETNNDKMIEIEYKKLLYDGNHRNLIKIIKTTYLRNKKRTDNNKKLSEKDENFFQKAEKLLYNEFSIALDIPYDEVEKYIKNRIEKVVK